MSWPQRRAQRVDVTLYLLEQVRCVIDQVVKDRLGAGEVAVTQVVG